MRVGVWFGASLFGRASEAVFRAICYALIAAAVLIGLPALDGVLRRWMMALRSPHPSSNLITRSQ